MEKDIDRIAKNQDTDIIIRIDDFGGKKGLTIREFVKSERYTGFTKSGTKIPADKFHLFKKAINSINEKDLEETAIETYAIPQKAPLQENAQEKQEKPKPSGKKEKKQTKPQESKEEIAEQEF